MINMMQQLQRRVQNDEDALEQVEEHFYVFKFAGGGKQTIVCTL